MDHPNVSELQPFRYKIQTLQSYLLINPKSLTWKQHLSCKLHYSRRCTDVVCNCATWKIEHTIMVQGANFSCDAITYKFNAKVQIWPEYTWEICVMLWTQTRWRLIFRRICDFHHRYQAAIVIISATMTNRNGGKNCCYLLSNPSRCRAYMSAEPEQIHYRANWENFCDTAERE